MTTEVARKEAIQDVQVWVREHGSVLYHFALMRVSDETLAEELVQNTLLAAIGAKNSYQGKSSIKTWLLGILKHKIMDHFRQNHREFSLSEVPEMEESVASDFTSAGKWKDKVQEWHFRPDEALEKQELRHILWECIDSLPDRMRTLFIMREIDGESTETICQRMEISVSNFSVLLHRARHKLRKEFISRGVTTLKPL